MKLGIFMTALLVCAVWMMSLLFILYISLLAVVDHQWILWSVSVVVFSTTSVVGAVIIDKLYILLLGYR